MRLEERLRAVAEANPDKSALTIVGGERLTFGELVSASEAVAAELVQAGVQPGDRVAILSGHDHRALVLLWGILRAGAIVVWLNDEPRGSGLPAALENADPRTVFVQGPRQRDLLARVGFDTSRVLELSAIGRPTSSGTTAPFPWSQSSQSLPSLPSLPGSATDPAAIVYTSGSSGEPKGVCLSHRNLTTVADAVIEHMPISGEDSYLMVVPLHYVHGLMQLFVHALASAPVFYHDNFMFPRKIVDILQQTRVTGFSGVPFHFGALIQRGGLLDAELPHLRWMTVTGGKLQPSMITEILDRFPGLDFHIAYGQTECGPRATALHPTRMRDKPDSVGSPIPNVRVQILGEDGAEVPRGEVGEVVVSGDNVMLGYWGDPEATAEAIDEEGRLRTGDLGRFDEDGDLFLAGRRSAMIKSAGERIIPGEIEAVLAGHPAVEEAVVLGVEDAALGQRVVAHVEVCPGGEPPGETVARLREHCLERLPPSRAPREYHLWSAFPRKPNGKPDRPAIATGDPNG